jgi:hypothetical protein
MQIIGPLKQKDEKALNILRSNLDNYIDQKPSIYIIDWYLDLTNIFEKKQKNFDKILTKLDDKIDNYIFLIKKDISIEDFNFITKTKLEYKTQFCHLIEINYNNLLPNITKEKLNFLEQNVNISFDNLIKNLIEILLTLDFVSVKTIFLTLINFSNFEFNLLSKTLIISGIFFGPLLAISLGSISKLNFAKMLVAPQIFEKILEEILFLKQVKNITLKKNIFLNNFFLKTILNNINLSKKTILFLGAISFTTIFFFKENLILLLKKNKNNLKATWGKTLGYSIFYIKINTIEISKNIAELIGENVKEILNGLIQIPKKTFLEVSKILLDFFKDIKKN